jgi:hypothetical protein
MCRIMMIRSPCVGMTRPAACPVVGLSALGRRRRPRWEGTLTRTVPGMPSAVPGRTAMACSASRLTSACSSGACTRMKFGLRGDDRVADVLEWPGEFGAGPQGAGADLGGVAGVAQCGERPGLGERADRERGADLAQGGDDARIGDEVATRSPARPWILEKVRSTATRPEATSGRQVVASGSSVNST